MPCGRSLEDAFILANPELFSLKGTSGEKELEAYEKAKNWHKTDFAIEYAIEKTKWNVPRYIEEGLCWLAEGGHCLNLASSPIDAESADIIILPTQEEEPNA